MSASPSPAAIDELCHATLALGFDAARRQLLLAHLPPGYVAGLREHDKPGDQLRADLTTLATSPPLTGHETPPLRTWLGNALAIAEQNHHSSAVIYRRHLTPAPAATRTNLPPPNPFFVGREPAIAALHQRLTATADPVALTQPAVAHGHGGVGKTELAIACAWRHLADWPGGVWFVVADGQDPRQHLARLAETALDPHTAAALPDDTARADAVLRALTRGPAAALLIVDNLDDRAWFEPWRAIIPARGPLRLLVTTRAPRLPGLPAAAMLRVDRLTVDEGINLLARHRDDAAEDRHREAVAAIVEHLDGFAVALAAVGVYAAHQDGFDWTAYYPALRDRPLATVDVGEALAEEDGEQRRYRARAVAVFDDTLNLLAARRPDTRRALDHAALLPEAGFPPRWLAWLAARAGTREAPRPGVDPAAAPGAALLNDGLLRPAPDGFVALHRWLRAVVRAGMTHDRKAALLDDLFALGVARGDVCADAVLQPALRPELTPLLALAETLRAAGRLGEAARVVNRVGEPLYDLGRYAALHAALAPLAGADGHLLGPGDDGQGAVVLSHLGLALQALGQFTAARARHEQALAAAEFHHGPDHAELAAVRSNLALVLRALGELPTARRHLEAAIDLDTRHLGPDHPALAIRYSNLATVLQDLGELPAARRHLEAAIELETRHLGPDHPALATSYSNLATVLQDLGELPAARRHLEAAIDLDTRHLGPDHPALATGYSNLALVLKDLGELPAARRHLEAAIEFEIRHLGPDHPTLAVSYSNLALVLKDLGELPAARRHLEAAIDLQTRHLGPDHPNLAIRYHNLAHVALAEGDRAAARGLWQRALPIAERALPPGHPHIRIFRDALDSLGPRRPPRARRVPKRRR